MDSRDIEKWRVELDSYAHVEDGVEYWLARDLMEPLGYTQWRNFGLVGGFCGRDSGIGPAQRAKTTIWN